MLLASAVTGKVLERCGRIAFIDHPIGGYQRVTDPELQLDRVGMTTSTRPAAMMVLTTDPRRFFTNGKPSEVCRNEFCFGVIDWLVSV
jgi:hypothetical protein